MADPAEQFLVGKVSGLKCGTVVARRHGLLDQAIPGRRKLSDDRFVIITAVIVLLRPICYIKWVFFDNRGSASSHRPSGTGLMDMGVHWFRRV